MGRLGEEEDDGRLCPQTNRIIVALVIQPLVRWY